MGNWLPNFGLSFSSSSSAVTKRQQRSKVDELAERARFLLGACDFKELREFQDEWLQRMSDAIAGDSPRPWFGKTSRRAGKSLCQTAVACAQSTLTSELVTIIVSTDDARGAIIRQIEQLRIAAKNAGADWKFSDMDVVSLPHQATARRMQLEALTGFVFWDEWALHEELEKLTTSTFVEHQLREMGVKDAVRNTGMTTPTHDIGSNKAEVDAYYPLSNGSSLSASSV